jgi:hypothetical protein
VTADGIYISRPGEPGFLILLDAAQRLDMAERLMFFDEADLSLAAYEGTMQ